jgi:aminomethyltransferase
MSVIRATPFHARAADANRLNAWTARNGWTLSAHYGDPREEAVACRTTAGLADISWRCRVMIEGTRAEEFLKRLLTRDAAMLALGMSLKALWLNDGGGLRGAGLVARYGRESFLLVSTAPDMEWIAKSAALFDVQMRDVSEREGGLAIIGPNARKIVETSGLDANLEPLAFRKLFWRGLDITLSRWGEHGGYELWCEADAALIAWDHIARAGEPSALRPVGVDAMDVLDMEAGIPRPGRDYEPARDGHSGEPSPKALGLASLVDADHAEFNGRAAFLATKNARMLVGVEFDSDKPQPDAPLASGGRVVGRTLGSFFSPALERAIALAVVDAAASNAGTALSVGATVARVVALPFLTNPT